MHLTCVATPYSFVMVMYTDFVVSMMPVFPTCLCMKAHSSKGGKLKPVHVCCYHRAAEGGLAK